MSDREQLGRLLVAGMGPGGGVAEATPPQWAIDWPRLIGLADRHLVLPALERALVRLDRLPADPELVDVLATVSEANALRNEALRTQLGALGRSLNEAGLEACLLKGAIRLVDDLYPAPAWRYMSDLDILLPEEQAHEAWRHLQTLGYRAKVVADALGIPDHHHLPPLLHPERAGMIEVHTALGHPRERRLLPADEVWRSSHVISVDGARFRVPTTDHQLVHAIGHQFLQHRGHWSGSLRLRDLLEVYCLAARADCDVAACRERFAAVGCEPQATACLLLVDRTFGSRWASRSGRRAWLLAIVAEPEHEMTRVGAVRRQCWFWLNDIRYLLGRPGRLARKMMTGSFYTRRFREIRRLCGAIANS